MPVDPLFDDFERDMTTYGVTLALIESTSELQKLAPLTLFEGSDPNAAHLEAISNLAGQVKIAQPGIPALRGAMYVLCLARFESLIRNQIEDLALRASQNATLFSQLPRTMKESLQKLAADVIANPRKYRMEKHIKSIASTLSKNLSDQGVPGEINNYCMSITHENMRAETLSGLFERFGIADAWARIGSDTELQVYLQLHQSDLTSSSAKKRLNAAVETRNRFSHPSGTVTWPSNAEITELMQLLLCIGRAVSKLIPVYGIQLKPQPQAQPASGGN